MTEKGKLIDKMAIMAMLALLADAEKRDKFWDTDFILNFTHKIKDKMKADKPIYEEQDRVDFIETMQHSAGLAMRGIFCSNTSCYTQAQQLELLDGVKEEFNNLICKWDAYRREGA